MSWQINPANGDYIMNSNGAPTDDPSPIYPAYYRISIPNGKWLYAPDANYGSTLNSIGKNQPNLVINSAQRAVNPLVDEGLAQQVIVQLDPTFEGSRDQDGIQVSILNNQGIVETLPLPLPPVGD